MTKKGPGGGGSIDILQYEEGVHVYMNLVHRGLTSILYFEPFFGAEPIFSVGGDSLGFSGKRLFLLPCMLL